MRLSYATLHIMTGLGCEQAAKAKRQWISLIVIRDECLRLQIQAWSTPKQSIEVALVCM